VNFQSKKLPSQATSSPMAQAMIIIILSSGAYSLKNNYAAIRLPIFLEKIV